MHHAWYSPSPSGAANAIGVLRLIQQIPLLLACRDVHFHGSFNLCTGEEWFRWCGLVPRCMESPTMRVRTHNHPTLGTDHQDNPSDYAGEDDEDQNATSDPVADVIDDRWSQTYAIRSNAGEFFFFCNRYNSDGHVVAFEDRCDVENVIVRTGICANITVCKIDAKQLTRLMRGLASARMVRIRS